jgi:F-type H+-transporting ATPase subunit a
MYTFNPLDQFEVRDYLLLDLPIFADMRISLTNISLYLFIGSIIIVFIHMIETDFIKLVSDK